MISGRLDPFFETGTEGVIWSLTDTSLPGYDGLWPLYTGDHLRIIGADDDTAWEGTVVLEYQRNWQPYPANPSYGQQAVNNYWVHGLQADLDPDRWAGYFFEKYRGELTPGPEQRPSREPHPFHGTSAAMEERLRAAPDPEQLYRTALYPWLWFLSDGESYSLAKEWQFAPAEILQLLGSPTPEQLSAWKAYPKKATDTLIPFNWQTFVRVALLYGVYGALDRKFHEHDAAAAWLVETGAKALLLGDIAGVAELRDRLTAISQ